MRKTNAQLKADIKQLRKQIEDMASSYENSEQNYTVEVARLKKEVETQTLTAAAHKAAADALRNKIDHLGGMIAAGAAVLSDDASLLNPNYMLDSVRPSLPLTPIEKFILAIRDVVHHQ